MDNAEPARKHRAGIYLTADEAARLEYSASYAAQGPFGTGDPALLRRLENWSRRRAPVRARLDATTLQALLALAPLFEAYREYIRETQGGHFRAAPPPDDAAAALEAKLRAALARLEGRVLPLGYATIWRVPEDGGMHVTRTIDRAQIEQLLDALRRRNIESEYHETGAEALARLKELVPLGTEVQTGSSTTLDQIGFTAWLRELHGDGKVRYFRAETQQHADPAARTANRRQALLAQYFLGSVNALTEDGVALVSDASGSRLGGYIFGAQNVIWVVGVNKIVSTFEDAMRRLREVALPQEDARVKELGEKGSSINKVGVFFGENATGRIRLLLIGESLGF